MHNAQPKIIFSRLAEPNISGYCPRGILLPIAD